MGILKCLFKNTKFSIFLPFKKEIWEKCCILYLEGDDIMAKDLMIRSSAEEFITFKVGKKDKGI